MIVVDDCSTKDLDLLEAIIKEYSWVEWYDTGTNGGGGKARNVGLKYAKGKYLIFADSDDFFNLCFDDALDKYKDSNHDIIYFAANSVDTETYLTSNRGDFLNRIISKFQSTHNPSDLLFKHTAPWSKFISHKLVKDHNISFQESTVYNDMAFSQSCDYHAKDITAELMAVYCVTFRNGSVSSIENADKEIEKVKVMVKYYSFFKERNINYDYTGLVAPTYFDLKKMKASGHIDIMFDLWQSAGLSRSEIKKTILSYRLKSKVIKYYELIKLL